MSETRGDESCPSQISEICKRRHWGMYWLIILVSVATIGGRVATVKNHYEPGESAFFCANDRSRWSTIHSLVDHGTYEIDRVLESPSEIRWDTIDKVRHKNRQAQQRFYSSKPTLLPTILAGEYWILKKVTGLSLSDRPLMVSRILLLISNVLPYFLFLFLLAAMLERIVVHDWTRYFTLCAAGFGTYLSTFAVTLNNHLPAAICVMVALYALDRIYRTGPVCHDAPKASGWHYAMVGLFSAFAAANELPALSFLVFAAVLCWRASPRQTRLGFLPGALLVICGFFFTNWLAHGTWKPAYMHRSDGALIATVQGDFADQLSGPNDAMLTDGQVPQAILNAVQKDHSSEFVAPVCRQSFWKRDRDAELGRWVLRDSVTGSEVVVEQVEPNAFELRQSGNWYDYVGSYWASGNRSEIDRGEPSKTIYAFHLLFGHHGIFSLTPIWLLGFAGLLVLPTADRLQLKWLGWMGISLSLVVFLFYMNRPVNDRNYGGYTSALRWMFWLIPIWLVAMVPVVDSLSKKKWGKSVCLGLLGLSIASALYSVTNPWCHPWLYEVWESLALPNL